MIRFGSCGTLARLLAVVLAGTQCARGQASPQDRAVIDQTIRAAVDVAETGSQITWTALPDEESQLLESEFGIQQLHRVVPKAPDWVVSLNGGGFFTSNAGLVPFDEHADWVGRAALRAAWSPRISPHLSARVAANHSLWRYADWHFLDFDDLGVQAGLLWNNELPALAGGLPSWTGWMHYRFNRLIRPWKWNDVLYEAHFAEAGLRRAWALRPDWTCWLGGNAAASIDAEPGLFRRNEFSLQAGSLWQMTPKLDVTLLWRAAWFHHLEDPRRDFNQLLFAGLSWKLRPQLRADLYIDGVINESNFGVFDYSLINTGVNLAITKGW